MKRLRPENGLIARYGRLFSSLEVLQQQPARAVPRFSQMPTTTGPLKSSIFWPHANRCIMGIMRTCIGASTIANELIRKCVFPYLCSGSIAPVKRSADDANEVVILQDVSDVAKACTWYGSSEMKTTWEKAGVLGSPSIRFAAAA